MFFVYDTQFNENSEKSETFFQTEKCIFFKKIVKSTKLDEILLTFIIEKCTFFVKKIKILKSEVKNHNFLKIQKKFIFT